jgi:hypothetical protein
MPEQYQKPTILSRILNSKAKAFASANMRTDAQLMEYERETCPTQRKKAVTPARCCALTRLPRPSESR